MTRAKVLVVDDEELLLWSVAEKLGEGGFTVETAGDGRSARDLMERESFALALFDIRLPDTNGMELAAAFHQLHPEAAFLIMSAYATPELREEAERLGARAFLEKPFDFDEMLECVRQALQPS